MTDGERLVWATSFSIALDKNGNAIDAVQVAARAVEQLREVGQKRLPGGKLAISQIDDRDLLDEIVSVP